MITDIHYFDIQKLEEIFETLNNDCTLSINEVTNIMLTVNFAKLTAYPQLLHL